MTDKKILWLTLFAIAMANVEAAVVIYLRSVYYPDNPLALFPLSMLSSRDLLIELLREAATLVMIFSVAILAGKKLQRIFAAFLYVFGVWDIFYYAWLKVLIGWPASWLEWDLLFLIPWPWLAPWIAAALVAVLFVLRGGWTLWSKEETPLSPRSLAQFVVGSSVVLVTFLLPAWPLLSGGEAAFRRFQPTGFLWGAYLVGYLLMLIGLLPYRRTAR